MDAIVWSNSVIHEGVRVRTVYKQRWDGKSDKLWKVNTRDIMARFFQQKEPVDFLIGVYLGRAKEFRYFVFLPPHKTLTELKTNIRTWRALFRAAT